MDVTVDDSGFDSDQTKMPTVQPTVHEGGLQSGSRTSITSPGPANEHDLFLQVIISLVSFG